MAEILPGPPVAQGNWKTITSSHLLIRMQDGNVLDWDRDDGSWRLFAYDPTNKQDVLPGPELNSGKWPSIVWHPHYLIKMIDGRVLDWNEDDGTWRLWNYDAKVAGNVLPSLQASGQWKTIKSTKDQTFPYAGHTHRLIPMPDGNVLDFGPREEGLWRLWSYAPLFVPDVLPTLLGQGKWQSIVAGAFKPKGTSDHWLIPMPDGNVLDWVPADGSYRLWKYDPYAKDILPGDPLASGKWPEAKWGSGGAPDHLVVMQDGRVLAWTEEGAWSLWDYDLPERLTVSRPYKLGAWFAEIQPLARVISGSLYATLTKPRPPVSRLRKDARALVGSLGATDRRALADEMKRLKAYVDAVEAALKER